MFFFFFKGDCLVLFLSKVLLSYVTNTVLLVFLLIEIVFIQNSLLTK